MKRILFLCIAGFVLSNQQAAGHDESTHRMTRQEVQEYPVPESYERLSTLVDYDLTREERLLRYKLSLYVVENIYWDGEKVETRFDENDLIREGFEPGYYTIIKEKIRNAGFEDEVFFQQVLEINERQLPQVKRFISRLESPRTEEQLRFDRIFEQPDDRLTDEERLIKCKVSFMVNNCRYIENGKMLTRLTEKDFTDMGLPASFYYEFLENDADHETFMSFMTVEERTNAYKDMMESWNTEGHDMLSGQIRELEKKVATYQDNK